MGGTNDASASVDIDVQGRFVAICVRGLPLISFLAMSVYTAAKTPYIDVTASPNVTICIRRLVGMTTFSAAYHTIL